MDWLSKYILLLIFKAFQCLQAGPKLFLEAHFQDLSSRVLLKGLVQLYLWSTSIPSWKLRRCDGRRGREKAEPATSDPKITLSISDLPAQTVCPQMHNCTFFLRRSTTKNYKEKNIPSECKAHFLTMNKPLVNIWTNCFYFLPRMCVYVDTPVSKVRGRTGK